VTLDVLITVIPVFIVIFIGLSGIFPKVHLNASG
jgi:hypothetical protein